MVIGYFIVGKVEVLYFVGDDGEVKGMDNRVTRKIEGEDGWTYPPHITIVTEVNVL